MHRIIHVEVSAPNRNLFKWVMICCRGQTVKHDASVCHDSFSWETGALQRRRRVMAPALQTHDMYTAVSMGLPRRESQSEGGHGQHRQRDLVATTSVTWAFGPLKWIHKEFTVPVCVFTGPRLRVPVICRVYGSMCSSSVPSRLSDAKIWKENRIIIRLPDQKLDSNQFLWVKLLWSTDRPPEPVWVMLHYSFIHSSWRHLKSEYENISAFSPI